MVHYAPNLLQNLPAQIKVVDKSHEPDGSLEGLKLPSSVRDGKAARNKSFTRSDLLSGLKSHIRNTKIYTNSDCRRKAYGIVKKRIEGGKLDGRRSLKSATNQFNTEYRKCLTKLCQEELSALELDLYDIENYAFGKLAVGDRLRVVPGNVESTVINFVHPLLYVKRSVGERGNPEEDDCLNFVQGNYAKKYQRDLLLMRERVGRLERKLPKGVNIKHEDGSPFHEVTIFGTTRKIDASKRSSGMRQEEILPGGVRLIQPSMLHPGGKTPVFR